MQVDHPDNHPNLKAGAVGTVVNIHGPEGIYDCVRVGVDWGEAVGTTEVLPGKVYHYGHACDVLTGDRKYYGWWVNEDEVALVGGPSYSAVTERMIEPALETAMPELDPAFTDLL